MKRTPVGLHRRVVGHSLLLRMCLLWGMLQGFAGCESRQPLTDAELAYPVAAVSLEAFVLSGGNARPEAIRGAVQGPLPVSSPAPAFDAALPGLLDGYFALWRGLAADRLAEVAPAVALLRPAVERALSGPLPGATPGEQENVRRALVVLQATLPGLAEARDLPGARSRFALVSDSLLYLVAFHAGRLPERPLYAYYCPMKKQAWLQDVRGMGNPYHGPEMSLCGETLPRSGRSTAPQGG